MGKIQPLELKRILERRKRTEKVVSAPAKGLCLEKVFYRKPAAK
jgi:tRNA U38,U39,U40 pseudouridine synthase TruA